MKVNAKVLSAFYHGNQTYSEGITAQFAKGEAHDLEKAGLVEVTGEVEDSGVKMADAPENKMADAPANKSRTKKAE
jgi:hypothetical protein